MNYFASLGIFLCQGRRTQRYQNHSNPHQGCQENLGVAYFVLKSISISIIVTLRSDDADDNKNVKKNNRLI